MRRFRFPLERLQRLRSHQERIARREFAERVAVLNEIDHDLTVVESNLDVCHDDDRRPHSLGEAMSAGLGAVERRLRQKRVAASEAAEAARLIYLERRRDHEALCRMRDRKLEDWRIETSRGEQQEMDDVARLRFKRDGEGDLR